MITHEIIGDDMQAVVVSMAAGDEIRAEAGAMTYMTDGIDMDARMTGGILGGLTRKFLAGESLFLTYFKCAADTGRVAFSPPYPVKIIRFPPPSSAMIWHPRPFPRATGAINPPVQSTNLHRPRSPAPPGLLPALFQRSS